MARILCLYSANVFLAVMGGGMITGGEIAWSIDHGECNTDIHETVFKGLIFDQDRGFIQIDWI